MTRQGRVQNLAASPTLVGALTVLITVVAVFLAYNANQGLPFVQTYRLSATVPNANTLVPGNEVRIGGTRVGTVERVDPITQEDGSVAAELDLSLDKEVEPIPEDSTVIIRSRSPLGLKYLDVIRGNSEDGYPAGATIPLSQARPEPVEIDEVISTFDDPTRNAIQINLREFGDTLAGRGGDLNTAIRDLKPLVTTAVPVMRNLSSSTTDLAGFVRGLSAVAGETAPVAEEQAQLFVNLDITFGAFADVARPFIQDTITRSVPALETANRVFPKVRPFFRHTATFFENLQPGARATRRYAPALADASAIGIKALRLAPDFNAELDPTAQSLLDLSNDASARQGIEDLTDAVQVGDPAVAFVAPAQSVCNYASLLFRNLADIFRYGNSLGTYQRFINFNPFGFPESQGVGPNNQGMPASAPANGPGILNYLHYNPYPNTASPGQTFECEAGNEAYVAGQKQIGNSPGNQGIRTEGQTEGQLNAKPSN
jgi:virulence factor Mce-like protein